jgi:hypothetical protein
MGLEKGSKTLAGESKNGVKYYLNQKNVELGDLHVVQTIGFFFVFSFVSLWFFVVALAAGGVAGYWIYI